MSEFIKWMDTGALHNLVRDYAVRIEKYPEYLPPIITYKSKIKLHGTNAGIHISPDGVVAQSRSKFLTPDNDNRGFAKWVKETEAHWGNLFGTWEGTAIAYGEWTGRGINKGTSANLVKDKFFAVFAVKIIGADGVHHLVTNPAEISVLLSIGENSPSNAYVIPWYEDGIETMVNFGNKEQLQQSADEINEMVLEVEKCDPWIKETFDIEGIGEGLVFYPVYKQSQDDNSRYKLSNAKLTRHFFKAKGEKHRVVKQKKAVQIDPEHVASVKEFVELVLPDARLEQGLSEVGGVAVLKQMGNFLKWISEDVQKECQAELEASELVWKMVSKSLMFHARDWFMKKVDHALHMKIGTLIT